MSVRPKATMYVVSYEFHDYKAAGVERARLEAWCRELGWEAVLNRAGTSFRKLPDDRKTALTQDKAIRLMLENPSLIKRPVLDLGARRVVGFKPGLYAGLK